MLKRLLEVCSVDRRLSVTESNERVVSFDIDFVNRITYNY